MSIDYLKAEFKDLHTDEIEIIGYRYLYSHNRRSPDIIYPKKKDLLWIINILRGSSFEDVYHFGYRKEELERSDDYFILLKISGGDDRSFRGHVRIFVYNKNHPRPAEDEPGEYLYGATLSIAFDSDDPMNPNDSLATFIRQLEEYVPAEDKDQIIPAWKTSEG